MEIDLAKALHGFGLQFLESFQDHLSKFLISNQKGRKTSLWYKRMVQRQDDKVVVDHMERMAKFSRVPHSGHVFHVRSVLAEKTHRLRRRPVSKAKDNLMVNFVLSRVSSNPSENREATCGQTIDRSRSPCSRYDQIRFLAVVR